MKITLLQITENADLLIEQIGRLCWKSEDRITKDSHKKFIEMLLKNKHESVLEHAIATFKIEGITRACSHQLVRHRIASYTQKSQRYVKEKIFEYIIPGSIINNYNKTVALQYTWLLEKIQETYDYFLSNGIKPEDARFILPNACTTEIVMTMNFRSLRHFLKERTSKGAQWEIKELALLILQEMKKNSICFNDINE